MPLNATYDQGSGIEFDPGSGSFYATLTSVEEVEQRDFDDPERSHPALRFVYTLHNVDAAGNDQQLWRTVRCSLNEKANLYKDLVAMLGHAVFNDVKRNSNALNAEIDALVGRQFVVQVGRSQSDKPKITGVSSPPTVKKKP